MFKSKNKGLAIVETILVLAISAALFAVVIGVLSSRQKTQYDDAARQLMSEIAEIRNEAQQGEGPRTEDERNLQSGKELYGKAIKFNTDSNGLAKSFSVEDLFLSNSGITARPDRIVETLDKMNWYINPGSAAEGYCSQNLTSCFLANDTYKNLGSNNIATDGGLVLVFLNRTGQGYALGSNNYLDNNSYILSQQLDLRLALGIIEDGITAQDKMNNAIAQYYANINLLIPNSQSLKVVK